jgi:hypothetical protein
MDIMAVMFGDLDWINLPKDWDWWWALVNVVMNLQIS